MRSYLLSAKVAFLKYKFNRTAIPGMALGTEPAAGGDPAATVAYMMRVPSRSPGH